MQFHLILCRKKIIEMDKNLKNRRVLLNILKLVNREQLYPTLMNLTRLRYIIKKTFKVFQISLGPHKKYSVNVSFPIACLAQLFLKSSL